MKILAHLSTGIFIITRFTTVSGYKKAFATTTGFKGHLQPLSADKTNLYNGVMGKTYVIYTEGAIDIQEGDKLRDTSTNKFYKVSNGGVSRRSFGIVDFNQVIIEEIT